MTWRTLTERTRRLGHFFLGQGLTAHRERPQLGDSEVGQDRVAVLLHNRPEYIETMLGAFKARLAPCNVNYRYVASELASLFEDMAPAAVVYESQFAEVLGHTLATTAHRPVLVEVGSAKDQVALSGAVAYEERWRARRLCVLPSRGRPTTSTSSTRGARPERPRGSSGARRTSSSPHWGEELPRREPGVAIPR